jgi:hypothetical protein
VASMARQCGRLGIGRNRSGRSGQSWLSTLRRPSHNTEPSPKPSSHARQMFAASMKSTSSREAVYSSSCSIALRPAGAAFDIGSPGLGLLTAHPLAGGVHPDRNPWGTQTGCMHESSAMHRGYLCSHTPVEAPNKSSRIRATSSGRDGLLYGLTWCRPSIVGCQTSMSTKCTR